MSELQATIALITLGVLITIPLIHKVFTQFKRTDAGIFSVWIETETINDHQLKVVSKYSFCKWCYLIVTTYKTDKDYYNNL